MTKTSGAAQAVALLVAICGSRRQPFEEDGIDTGPETDEDYEN